MKWRCAIETYLSIHSHVNNHKTHFHLAFLFLRGTLLAVASNQVGSRSRGAGYSDYTMHAERAVVKEIGDISKLRDATLVVIRLGKHGEFLNSKPCSSCQLFINKCHRCYGLSSFQHS